MKRFFALTLALILMLSLTACGLLTKCDICGDLGARKKLDIYGETFHLCSSCYREYQDTMDEINDYLDDFDYGDYDFGDYDFGDYDLDDYDFGDYDLDDYDFDFD